MLRASGFAFLLLLLTPALAGAQSHVVINGERIAPDVVTALEQQYGVRVQAGRYWYDARSGAWGFDGGPTVGFIAAGVDVGGPLRENASRGASGVFINGRELPAQDVTALYGLLGAVYPGRYWMDAQGYVGAEGGPALLNLFQLARQAQRQSFYRSDITDTGYGASGDTFYVMGKDWSVTVTN